MAVLKTKQTTETPRERAKSHRLAARPSHFIVHSFAEPLSRRSESTHSALLSHALQPSRDVDQSLLTSTGQGHDCLTSYRYPREMDEVLAEDVHQLPRPDLVGSGAGDSEQPRLVVDHGERLRCLRPVEPGKMSCSQKKRDGTMRHGRWSHGYREWSGAIKRVRTT